MNQEKKSKWTRCITINTDASFHPTQKVGGGSTDWKKPLIDRVKYDLRRYTELAKRMDELMHEYNLEANYVDAKEAEIKRNCYNRFVNDLKQLVR